MTTMTRMPASWHFDGAGHLGAGRVQHADEAEEGQGSARSSAYSSRGLGAGDQRVASHVVARGEGDDTQAAVAVVDDFSWRRVRSSAGHGHLLAAGADEGVGAALDDGLWGALDQQLLLLAVLDQDGARSCGRGRTRRSRGGCTSSRARQLA